MAEPSSPLGVTAKYGKNFEGIHLDAGADLLNYYQFHWCRIREASEHNFRLADVQNISSIAVLIIHPQHLYSRNQIKQSQKSPLTFNNNMPASQH